MSSTSITKNTAFMTIASIGQKVVSFVYFTMIARQIGAEGTGKYFFALSFTTIFVVFVDLGFTNVLVREAAKAKDKIQSYLSTILAGKIVFGVLSYIVVFFIINLMGYPIETRHLVYLSAITMLFDSLHLTLYGVLRAIGDLRYEAGSIVASQIITLGLGSYFLYHDYPLIYLILAFTIASACNVLFVSTLTHFKFRLSLVPRFDKSTFFHLGAIAIPFAVAGILARVYGYVDSVILSKMAGDIAVGWYSIPYKITFAFQFVPLALVATLYPRLSEAYAHDRMRLAYMFERAMKYLLIIAFPIAIGISVLARDIVLSLYTAEYEPSILPLQILVLSLIFSFLSFPIGAFLNACDRQVTQTKIVACVLTVNVIMNILLIPSLGVVGAALSAFVGNFLMTIIGYIFVPRVAVISHRYIAKAVGQIACSALVMGALVWLVNQYTSYLIAIVGGAIVYSVMLFATRALTRRDMREAMTLLKK